MLDAPATRRDRDEAPYAEDEAGKYLAAVGAELGSNLTLEVRSGDPAVEIAALAQSGRIDAVVMTTRGRPDWQRWLSSSVASTVIYKTTPPVIVVRPTDTWRSTRTRFSRLLVPLDGSHVSEQVLSFVKAIARRFQSEVVLFSAADGSEPDDFVANLRKYLARIAAETEREGIAVRVLIGVEAPVNAIVRVATAERADLIMMVSHGRGGVERQVYVPLGSVAAHVLRESPCPVFLVSATRATDPS